ncbi:hypothetical protein AAT19DRAFT_9577, partial [Rhodotorula toruloides]
GLASSSSLRPSTLAQQPAFDNNEGRDLQLLGLQDLPWKGQALRPPRLEDLPLRLVEGGVALPPAQEPAQDRVDRRLPPRQQEGCHGGGREEALAQDGQAPAWCCWCRRRRHPCQAQPEPPGSRCAACRRPRAGQGRQEGEGVEEGQEPGQQGPPGRKGLARSGWKGRRSLRPLISLETRWWTLRCATVVETL